MGGLDWAALPLVAEMLGIAEPEKFIVQLVAIRHYQNRTPDHEN